MAEGKKGFLLYSDLIHTIEKMPPEKAGELFLHILKYVNDLQPETDDLLIQIAFEPIKRQLKRDLDKWENKTSKKSEGGKLGNLKRWHKDIYKQYEDGCISLDKAYEIAENRTASDTDKKRSEPIAKIAVNDNVNVNVNVNDNVINNKKTKAKKTATHDQFFIDQELNSKFLEWINYRKEIKKSLKPTTAEKQIKFLLRFKTEEAIQVIDQSIMNGWTGLFELKNKNNGTTTRKESPNESYQRVFKEITDPNREIPDNYFEL